MTRHSKRELKRRIDELEESTTAEPHPLVRSWRARGVDVPDEYDADPAGAIMHNLRAYHDDVPDGGVDG